MTLNFSGFRGFWEVRIFLTLDVGVILGGRSDIFYFCLLGGGERGVRGARRGADDFLLKIPGGEGSPGRVGEGLGGCLRGIWGGLIFFFSGPKFPPSIQTLSSSCAKCLRQLLPASH